MLSCLLRATRPLWQDIAYEVGVYMACAAAAKAVEKYIDRRWPDPDPEPCCHRRKKDKSE